MRSLPLIEGDYLSQVSRLKFAALSAGARKLMIDLPNPIPRLNIAVRREDQDTPPFQGGRVGTIYSAEYGGLILDGLASFDAVPDVDALVRLTSALVGPLRQYYFNNILDLGGVFSVRLNAS